jgi:hypothetical protein
MRQLAWGPALGSSAGSPNRPRTRAAGVGHTSAGRGPSDPDLQKHERVETPRVATHPHVVAGGARVVFGASVVETVGPKPLVISGIQACDRCHGGPNRGPDFFGSSGDLGPRRGCAWRGLRARRRPRGYAASSGAPRGPSSAQERSNQCLCADARPSRSAGLSLRSAARRQSMLPTRRWSSGSSGGCSGVTRGFRPVMPAQPGSQPCGLVVQLIAFDFLV